MTLDQIDNEKNLLNKSQKTISISPKKKKKIGSM